MSAAAAVSDAPAPKGGKKKLIIIVGAALALLAVVGVVLLLLLKKSPAADDEDGSEAPAQAAAKRDPKAVPAYVPLDIFTVNLADREAERYAQVGITLEVGQASDAEAMKTFMPAIRSNILMVLAHKTSTELLEKEGKVKLAEQIKRAASRAIGVEVPEEAEPAESTDEDNPKKNKKKPKKKPEVVLPVTAVHFSNFIVQ